MLTFALNTTGPAKFNLDESISTLRFASTAKRIKNNAKINEDSKDALLRKFQEQIAELKKQLEEAPEEGPEDDEVVDKGDESKLAGGTGQGGQGVSTDMAEKLKSLEQKIIIGGENLLEKAETQERLLAESEAELQAIR